MMVFMPAMAMVGKIVRRWCGSGSGVRRAGLGIEDAALETPGFGNIVQEY